jgi:hypothetical protein
MAKHPSSSYPAYPAAVPYATEDFQAETDVRLRIRGLKATDQPDEFMLTGVTIKPMDYEALRAALPGCNDYIVDRVAQYATRLQLAEALADRINV